MIRFLVRAVVFLVSAAVGLLVAAAVVDGVSVGASGLLAAVVVFAVLQSVLAPFFAKVAARNAPAFLGGIGLVSTFVALLIASLFPGGLRVDGVVTWILATLIVWIVTALGTWLLGLWWLRNRRAERTA
jgi:uncharacterized membrane protein YvlD (DUF360 family)